MADKMVKADDGISEVPAPSAPEGGKAELDPKKKKATADSMEKVKAEEVEQDQEEEVVEEIVVETSVASLFEGEELSEEFKNKIEVVFEAAVSERVAKETLAIEENLTETLEHQLQESITERVDEIIENLDKYLDYVVKEWMEENEVAIEAGIKVEMAESFMGGLKDLFEQHNVEIDEETFDAVASLEEEIENLRNEANELVETNIKLQKMLDEDAAEDIFVEMTEGLTDVQEERFRTLAESLNKSDLEAYAKSLKVIKESFFAESAEEFTSTDSVLKDNLGDEEEVVIEEDVQAPASEYSSINALVEALNTRKANA